LPQISIEQKLRALYITFLFRIFWFL